ncbi:copper-binding protein [Lonsdalea populi]|uniref:Copper chaperone n=1 Tax=Lonsdalea populi TaxID=1172565 RepID=A0A3N0ULH4_9GAMM|nr:MULTISPECIES: heavy-metal-associated domain-containing protein [Lonsdalea]RAT15533.1 copper-binding protein [Lonsdalea quercina]RAT30248.1 copper-binding protein [Lonsdalea populi]RAT32250.1 copper-binding protein [Lonsdalea populi]RAT44854.1 copper-binding protein [Lonsdalea populi]RAT50372.1 copper-binding protein [Lonsdalea populi]
MSHTSLTVLGMVCGGCVSKVTHALQALEGVSQVSVTLESGLVDVEYAETETATPDAFRRAVEEIGFDVAG